MASIHRQAHSTNWKIVFSVPKDGAWFRSSGLSNRHLATILVNALELEAHMAATHGMTEDSIAQLEQILNDLFEYFNSRKRASAKLDDFVNESISLWSVGVSPKAIESFNSCKKSFMKWAKPKASTVSELTFPFINDYFRFLNASPYARNTVILQRSFITRLAKRAKELKLVRGDPLAGTFVKCKPKGSSNVQQHGITDEELRIVYGYLNNEINKNDSNT